MRSIDRRRFLQSGAAGLGAGLLTPAASLARAPIDAASTRASSVDAASTRVRMTGDGLGLTVADQASLLARLVEERGIERDSYSIGGVVEELEQRFARALGKERAVFLPTGTLANHLAVRILAGGPGRAIVQAESHLYNDSGDCVQTLSNITLMPLAPGRATFTLDEVKAVVERTSTSRVVKPVSVIVVETPVRRRTGEAFAQAELDRITEFARDAGIRLHLDGARLFLQSAFTGIDVADYARPFDTVYVSLYKYFNAVSGAILAGPSTLLDELYHMRRMFGAGLPGVWPYAAVALHYLDGFTDRYAAAVAVARSFLDEVARHRAFTVERVRSGTNLVRLRVDVPDLERFRARLGERGIRLGSPREDGSFLLGVNETWSRQTPDALVAAFVATADRG